MYNYVRTHAVYINIIILLLFVYGTVMAQAQISTNNQ